MRVCSYMHSYNIRWRATRKICGVEGFARSNFGFREGTKPALPVKDRLSTNKMLPCFPIWERDNPYGGKEEIEWKCRLPSRLILRYSMIIILRILGSMKLHAMLNKSTPQGGHDQSGIAFWSLSSEGVMPTTRGGSFALAGGDHAGDFTVYPDTPWHWHT